MIDCTRIKCCPILSFTVIPKVQQMDLPLIGPVISMIKNLHSGCISLRKSKIGFFNPKESENGFCISLLNKSIQDLLDHGASKAEWILQFL